MEHDLADPYRGGLTSYGILLIVAAFIQATQLHVLASTATTTPQPANTSAALPLSATSSNGSMASIRSHTSPVHSHDTSPVISAAPSTHPAVSASHPSTSTSTSTSSGPGTKTDALSASDRTPHIDLTVQRELTGSSSDRPPPPALPNGAAYLTSWHETPVRLGWLLLSVLHFYGYQFDPRYYAVSIGPSGSFLPLHTLPPYEYNPPVVIIDPLDAHNNVGRNNFRFQSVQALFRDTYSKLLAALSSNSNDGTADSSGAPLARILRTAQ